MSDLTPQPPSPRAERDDASSCRQLHDHGPEVPPLEQFLQRPRRAIHARDPYMREGDLAGPQPFSEALGPFLRHLRMVRAAVAVQRDALVDEPEGVDLRGCA